MDTEVTPQVFVLLYYNQERKSDKPDVVVFDALPKLQQHVVDLVIRKIDSFEDRHKAPMLLYAKNKMYKEFFKFWRYLQSEKACDIGFDVHWEPEPQVVL